MRSEGKTRRRSGARAAVRRARGERQRTAAVEDGMIADFRAQWRALTNARPGRRFQTRYETSRRERRRGALARRAVRIALATISLVVAVALTVLPGPAILFFFIAGALLASESRAVARGLDGAELKLRAGAVRAGKIWRRTPTAGRVIAVLGLGGLAVWGAWLGHRLWMAA